MAHSISARKRVRQNEKRRLANREIKSALKTEVRKLLDLIHDRNVDGAKAHLVKVYKKLDQTAARGVIHRNQADRRKSRLAHRVTAMEQQAGASTGA